MAEQSKDEYIRRLWDIARNAYKGEISKMEEQDAQNIRMVAGIIVKDVKRATGDTHARVIVPNQLQPQIVTEIHRLRYAGITGTYRMLQQDHWFRGMKPLIRRVVKTCPGCIAAKGRALVPEVMAPDARPVELGERWHLDGICFKKKTLGYDHIIVAVDAATKYIVPSKS